MGARVRIRVAEAARIRRYRRVQHPRGVCAFGNGTAFPHEFIYIVYNDTCGGGIRIDKPVRKDLARAVVIDHDIGFRRKVRQPPKLCGRGNVNTE